MLTQRQISLLQFGLAYVHANRGEMDVDDAFQDEFVDPPTDAEYTELWRLVGTLNKNDNPRYPFIKITDVAKATGLELKGLSGMVTDCARLNIPLPDGTYLRLQTGDVPDNYGVMNVVNTSESWIPVTVLDD